jgi:HTH-type transcriptional regulator / antitoxin HipB
MLSTTDAFAYMVQITLRTPADIGALIKDRRRALGFDQAELAARIGVGRLWVNQVERGKPGASLGLVLRALAALGLELSSAEHGKQIGQKDLDGHGVIAAELRRRLT